MQIWFNRIARADNFSWIWNKTMIDLSLNSPWRWHQLGPLFLFFCRCCCRELPEGNSLFRMISTSLFVNAGIKVEEEMWQRLNQSNNNMGISFLAIGGCWQFRSSHGWRDHQQVFIIIFWVWLQSLFLYTTFVCDCSESCSFVNERNHLFACR